MATGYYGPGLVTKLCKAIDACLDEWGDDPEYGKTAQKLREVEQELDVLMMSPAEKQASKLEYKGSRVPGFNQSGQEPRDGDAS